MVLLDELRVTMSDYQKDMDELYEVLGVAAATERYNVLQEEIAKEGFWDDLEHSQKVLQESKTLENRINSYKKMQSELEDIITLIELSIEEGEFIAFVGPSGCGKSTTLRMIAGFEEITSGDFYIDGKRMNTVLPRDRGISMVFQNYALYPHMTVEKNISYGLKNMKVPADEIKKKVDWAIEILGLS